MGIDSGRYPMRDAGPGDGTDAVLVARTFGAPAPPRRRLRRARPKEAKRGAETTVPVTQLTIVEAEALEGDPEVWLAALRDDPDERDRYVDAGLVRAARALGARRVAAADPSIPHPTVESALVIRVGFGKGDALVEGEWAEAIELPRDEPRTSRSAALRPQERLSALLGGREPALACEELLLRGRSDLDSGRGREAALQLRVALEALLAERPALGQRDQDEDLAFLEGRRGATGDAANEALGGPLSPEREAEVAATLAVCERVLRRRSAFS